MRPAGIQPRRATIEDLPALRELWKKRGLPWSDLEKRVTEFQVIVSENGDMLGCLGLQIVGQQGNLHSEAFADIQAETEFQAPLWERCLIVARNHGLFRIWCNDTSPGASSRGFKNPEPSLILKLPGEFGAIDQPWLVLSLRDELPAADRIEREFELFKQAQREESERAMRRARMLRLLAAAIAFALLAVAIVIGGYVLRQLSRRSKR